MLIFLNFGRNWENKSKYDLIFAHLKKHAGNYPKSLVNKSFQIQQSILSPQVVLRPSKYQLKKF